MGIAPLKIEKNLGLELAGFWDDVESAGKFMNEARWVLKMAASSSAQ
jgi:hypothetical protein